MLIGAFADADWGSIKGNLNPADVGLIGQEKLDRSWAVGARLGWLPTDRFLAYVSGGYTNAYFKQIDYNSFSLAGDPPGVFTPAQNYGGWFIGTGYEYNLGWLPGLTWKTEYRFADYGSHTDPIADSATGAVIGVMNSKRFVQTLSSELVWRFNWDR